mmetsp:Transcript_48246/g.134680  ORF Transcript_48246/g.134680 Transcript_48246/m.134680 type:complete len:254 (-) Transcript_48246:1035-1796(-)
MATDVHMGAVAQHDLISSMACVLSGVSAVIMARFITARAAVKAFQFAWHALMSSRTLLIKPSCKRERTGSGLCQSSTGSWSMEKTSPPSSTSPPRISSREVGSTKRIMSASHKPASLRVLSTVRTRHISRTSPVGHTLAKLCASGDCRNTLTGCLSTTITWPTKPPAVPICASPPRPRTAMMSPGAISKSSASPPRLSRRSTAAKSSSVSTSASLEPSASPTTSLGWVCNSMASGSSRGLGEASAVTSTPWAD